jgi:nucleoside-diphosphate-sugar epimerase
MKSEIKPIFGTIRKGDMKHSNADISKTQKLLNYNPDIKFYEGLNKTLDYLTSLRGIK